MVMYRSKPTEIEAMQWQPDAPKHGFTSNHDEIVAWINANGGEAVYESEYVDLNGPQTPERIAVRTIDGWAYAAPGHYVVKGSIDFHPCDSETFEKRWERIDE